MKVQELVIKELKDEELPDEVHQMALRKIQDADDEIEQMRRGIKQDYPPT